MVDTPKPLQLGDACPNCAGDFRAALVPTADQRRRAEDREIREALPPHFDTMTEAQRADHGALYRCVGCGYETRFPIGARAKRATSGAAADSAPATPPPAK